MIEDAFHFLFICEKYGNQRQNMFDNLLNIHNFSIINLNLLLWGDIALSILINENVFRTVQKFIKDTKRFS